MPAFPVDRSPSLPSRYPAVLTDKLMYATLGNTDRQMTYVVRFDGCVDAERFERALRLLIDAEPIFGCVFVAKGRRAYWQRRTDLDTMTLSPCIETGDVEQALRAFTVERLDPSRDLPLRAQIIRGASGDTLAFKVSHIAADATGGRELLYMLAQIYRRLAEEPAYRPTPNTRGDRSLMQVFRRDGTFRQLFRLKKSRPDRTAGPFLRPTFPTNGKLDPTERLFIHRCIPPETFRAIRAYGRARGATVNDLMLTAVFRATFALISTEPGTTFAIQVPKDLRASLPGGRAGAICNMARTVPARLVPIPGETFEATLRRVSETMQAAKATPTRLKFWIRLSVGFAVFDMETMRGRFSSYDSTGSHSFTLSNFGLLDPAQLDFDRLPVGDAYAHGSAHRPPGVLLTFSSFRDRLRLTTGTFADAVDPALMDDFLDRIINELMSQVA